MKVSAVASTCAVPPRWFSHVCCRPLLTICLSIPLQLTLPQIRHGSTTGSLWVRLALNSLQNKKKKKKCLVAVKAAVWENLTELIARSPLLFGDTAFYAPLALSAEDAFSFSSCCDRPADLHLLCCQNTFSMLPVLHTGNLLSIKGRIIALFASSLLPLDGPLQLRIWFSQNGKFRQGDMLQMCFWHRPSILWLPKPPRMEKHFGPCQQDLNRLSSPLPAASTLHVLILIPDLSRNTVLLLFFIFISHSWMVYTVPQLFYLGKRAPQHTKKKKKAFMFSR